MGQAVSGSVNPTWADQHNTRYRERLNQTGATPDQEALKSAAELAKAEKGK